MAAAANVSGHCWCSACRSDARLARVLSCFYGNRTNVTVAVELVGLDLRCRELAADIELLLLLPVLRPLPLLLPLTLLLLMLMPLLCYRCCCRFHGVRCYMATAFLLPPLPLFLVVGGARAREEPDERRNRQADPGDTSPSFEFASERCAKPHGRLAPPCSSCRCKSL